MSGGGDVSGRGRPTRRVRLFQLVAPAGRGADDPGDLPRLAARRLRVERCDVLAAELVRRSLDARGRRPRWVLTIDATVVDSARLLSLVERRHDVRELGGDTGGEEGPLARLGQRPIVVGAGPAGLFCALALAEKGYRPLLLERGKDVRRRWKDVRAYWTRGELDPESNVAFGEGGAGTFSDGKVYTRRNDPRNPYILGVLAEAAGAPDILTSARPHLGTNRLSRALLALRPRLIDAGVEIRFDARVDGLLVESGRIRGVTLAGERIESDAVFLGAGHSARDVHRALLETGVALEARPFAVGARIEHPQELIDAAQYGDRALAEELGAATYGLAHEERGLAAHTFCTCPGGEVVAAGTEVDGVTVNGMSYSHRGQPFCNSAVVAEVPASEHALGGVELQRRLEVAAAEAGGGSGVAPAQRVSDFLAGRASTGEWETSYRLGVRGADVASLLPERVVEAMRLAIRAWGRKIPGFDAQGHLIAVEARTTSPVRVVRDRATHQSRSTPGLFPIGEGAGHAGGIVSAASDGLRAVERVAALTPDERRVEI